MKAKFLIITLLGVCLSVNAQIYKDSTASTEARVQDLIKRMTPEEKFWQLFMLAEDWKKDKSRYVDGAFGFEGGVSANEGNTAGQMIQNTAASSAGEMAEIINKTQEYFIKNTRLGIPILPFDEALHGLVHPGSTAFPQSIGLAATFDTGLMHRCAAAIATETKSRGIRQILSPVINIASDVRWGRVEETYGEDPFLTSEMAVAFISEFEHRNIIATPKHFISNVGDGGRDSYPIHQNERILRELYLPPFEAAFKRGGARSVMTSYNSLDGSPCTANNWLLNDLLKNEWGFKGFVISDAGATGGANVLHFTASGYTEATETAINNGLDVVFQTAFEHYTLFIDAFKNGKIPMHVIDSAVSRVLSAKFELGLFDHPYVNPAEAGKVNGCSQHRELALEAAQKSIVLLKNQHKLLPLDPAIKSIAVFGQDATEARLGGYSGPGNKPVSILEGIKNAVSSGTTVQYAKSCSRNIATFKVITSEFLETEESGKQVKGLTGTYYPNIDFSGEPAFVRTDAQVNFQWTLFSPDPAKLNYDFYSVCWTGKLKSPGTGRFNIGFDGNDGYRLYIDNKLLIGNWIKCGKSTKLESFNFEAGKVYDIKIDYYEPTGNAWFKLVWDYDVDKNADQEIENALNLAEKCDVSVVVAGISEGEFNDRAFLGLPGNQEKFISSLAETGKPVIVVLTGGSAITMSNWLNRVDAVVDVWYPGEAGGTAVAGVLFGKHNPAGRLPITFPVAEGQLPLVYNHKPTGRGDDYTDLTGQPLFPFGYGLSYTTFEYSGLNLSESKICTNGRASVSFILKNTGNRTGDEVVQLYIHDLLASVARPVTELKGFQRITLKPGEAKQITFEITPEILQMLDINLQQVVEPGDFRIMIGASSKDIRLSTTLSVK